MRGTVANPLDAMERNGTGESRMTPTPDFDGSEPDIIRPETYAEDQKLQQTKLLLLDMEHGIGGLRDLPSLAAYLIERGWRR